jgi:hypothetical protein
MRRVHAPFWPQKKDAFELVLIGLAITVLLISCFTDWVRSDFVPPDVRHAIGFFLYALTPALLLSQLLVPCFHVNMGRKIAYEFPKEAHAERNIEPPGTEWLGRWLGRVEVLVFTVLFVVGGRAAAAWILGWFVLKMATGWQRIQENRYHLRLAFRALILNLINMLCAMIGAGLFSWWKMS